MIPADLKAGDTLGRYEILMPVARGGMAAVWAARLVGSRGFQKVVAIKTMLPGMTDDPYFEAMLLDEARLAARIRHPHVVEIIDLGEEEEWLYLVMEWVNGETLFTVNKRAKAKGGIPTPLLLRILSGACAGLQAAHELRDDKGNLFDLVHRDISPQNIMVSFSGIVKVVDFGVAKAAGRSHETRVGGILKGKVPYLSPEQLSGGKLDRRADIFALGVLAYVMVSGRHPFKGENDLRTMENICTREPVPLRDLVPDTRSDVEQIIMRAMAKDAADRWPDCAELQRAFDQVLNSMGQSVTDGDVAEFMRDIVGDLMEERNKALLDAISRADSRVSAAPSKPVSSRKKPVVGGPLAVNAEGILPVALDDAETAEPMALFPSVSPVADVPHSSSIVVPAGGRRRSSSLPAVGLALIAALAGAAIALKLGKLPWLATRLGVAETAPATLVSPAAPPSPVPTQAPLPIQPAPPHDTPATPPAHEAPSGPTPAAANSVPTESAAPGKSVVPPSRALTRTTAPSQTPTSAAAVQPTPSAPPATTAAPTAAPAASSPKADSTFGF